MKNQLDKLSVKLKNELGKRIINDDRKDKDLFTVDELVTMEVLIKIAAASPRYKIPIVIRISHRYHLDFVWWDDGVDVLICTNSKGFSYF